MAALVPRLRLLKLLGLLRLLGLLGLLGLLRLLGVLGRGQLLSTSTHWVHPAGPAHNGTEQQKQEGSNTIEGDGDDGPSGESRPHRRTGLPFTPHMPPWAVQPLGPSPSLGDLEGKTEALRRGLEATGTQVSRKQRSAVPRWRSHSLLLPC